MRRPAKGGTTRPGLSRPGHGYGRVKPRPARSLVARPWLDDPEWWAAIEIPVDAPRREPVSDHS
jgi:hypothetical protein